MGEDKPISLPLPSSRRFWNISGFHCPVKSPENKNRKVELTLIKCIYYQGSASNTEWYINLLVVSTFKFYFGAGDDFLDFWYCLLLWQSWTKIWWENKLMSCVSLCYRELCLPDNAISYSMTADWLIPLVALPQSKRTQLSHMYLFFQICITMPLGKCTERKFRHSTSNTTFSATFQKMVW